MRKDRIIMAFCYEYFVDHDRKEKPKQVIVVILNCKLTRQTLDFQENDTAEIFGTEYSTGGRASKKSLQKLVQKSS